MDHCRHVAAFYKNKRNECFYAAFPSIPVHVIFMRYARACGMYR